MRNTSYIAILETGVPPADLDKTYGTYVDMFSGTLAREGRTFRAFRALEGELPDMDGDLKGVVITAVEANSAAAEKRLNAGDVIVKVTDEEVSNPADVQKRIDQLKKDGKKTALLLVANTEGDVRFIALTLQ